MIFRGIGWILKCAAFSLAVIVLANWLHWGGRTVSDQVKTQMAHARPTRWAGDARDWVGSATHRLVQAGSSEVTTRKAQVRHASRVAADSAAQAGRNAEAIAGTEREKLRSLIRELNSSGR